MGLMNQGKMMLAVLCASMVAQAELTYEVKASKSGRKNEISIVKNSSTIAKTNSQTNKNLISLDSEVAQYVGFLPKDSSNRTAKFSLNSDGSVGVNAKSTGNCSNTASVSSEEEAGISASRSRNNRRNNNRNNNGNGNGNGNGNCPTTADSNAIDSGESMTITFSNLVPLYHVSRLVLGNIPSDASGQYIAKVELYKNNQLVDTIELSSNGSSTLSFNNILSASGSANKIVIKNLASKFTFKSLKVVADEVDVPGCTDPSATNYNPAATVDDGSCQYLQVDEVCLDPTASNTANSGDYSNPVHTQSQCEYRGCTSELAYNFNPFAQLNDGSCQSSGTVNLFKATTYVGLCSGCSELNDLPNVSYPLVLSEVQDLISTQNTTLAPLDLVVPQVDKFTKGFRDAVNSNNNTMKNTLRPYLEAIFLEYAQAGSVGGTTGILAVESHTQAITDALNYEAFKANN